ncbi:virulence promoting factor [Salmonella enterica]|uniref:virulence promoting factor n=1 Tax=Salmonella enterica TaxID=28901 RepID=UPI00398C4198
MLSRLRIALVVNCFTIGNKNWCSLCLTTCIWVRRRQQAHRVYYARCRRLQ